MIRSTAPINDEMAHQLYVLQVLTFNLLEDRMMTKMDPQDQVGRETAVERDANAQKTGFSVWSWPGRAGAERGGAFLHEKH